MIIVHRRASLLADEIVLRMAGVLILYSWMFYADILYRNSVDMSWQSAHPLKFNPHEQVIIVMLVLMIFYNRICVNCIKTEKEGSILIGWRC